jgi:ribonuclease Z
MTSKLHFLGTSCMVPTKDRNHLSVAFEYHGSIFLFDCGEATQHQIKKMKLPLGKIKKIFISHWHGDHCIGLLGLMQTLSNTENVEKIEIHGPKDSKKYVSHMIKATIFTPTIPIEVHEHIPKEGELLTIEENTKYKIYCSKLNHSVPCIGYAFEEKDVYNIDKEKAAEYGLVQHPLLARAKLGLDIEYKGKTIKAKDITYVKKGKKICFVFDTRPCQGIDLLVKNATYLVMEATYIFETHGHKAEEYDHMSAKETAQIAQVNNVKHLIITHFSQRYKDVKEIEAEAKEYFEDTTVTYDLMTLKLK